MRNLYAGPSGEMFLCTSDVLLVVIHDPSLNSRRMIWSKDSSLLAVSFTNGLLVFFDIMASQMFSVRRFGDVAGEDVSKSQFSVENSLTGMFFVEERLKKTT
jgi:hypothetical protein